MVEYIQLQLLIKIIKNINKVIDFKQFIKYVKLLIKKYYMIKVK